MTADALACPTGWGQSDTHALVLSDGRPNPHPAAGQPYDTIGGREIVALVQHPQAGVPKAEAQWLIASAYAGHDARSHAAQRERGRFGLLAVDIDRGNPALADVLQALGEAVGGVRLAVYATRSSTPADRRWRALVPLATPLAGKDYPDTEAALFDLLEVAGVFPDRSLARPAQLLFLPNAGEFYQHAILGGARLDLAPHHRILQRREAKRAAERPASAERERKAARRAVEQLASAFDPESPIARFNARHALLQLLVRYGYTQAGTSSHWRSPHQASGTFATRVVGERRWISLSGSDAAAGLGHATATGARAGDAFDLFVHYEHGGDLASALAAEHPRRRA